MSEPATLLTDSQLDDLIAGAELHDRADSLCAFRELKVLREQRAAIDRVWLLAVQPGDVLVVRCEHTLPGVTKAIIVSRWKEILPNVNVVVQDNCLELAVVRESKPLRPEEHR